jgi:hypothetical protein
MKFIHLCQALVTHILKLIIRPYIPMVTHVLKVIIRPYIPLVTHML